MCHRSVKYTLKVDGMKCEGCVQRIENVLAKAKGVNSYKVSLEENTIELLLKKNKNVNDLIEKIEVLDFKISIIE